MFFIQVLQVDFLADFQFTQVYTGLLFLPPDVHCHQRSRSPCLQMVRVTVTASESDRASGGKNV